MGDQLYYHPAEAAYPLTRAEWALARAGYYRFMGVPRDPSLPLLAPPGDVVARRITSLADTRSWVRAPEYQFAAPADDAPLRLADLVQVMEPPGALEPAPAPRYDPRTLARLPDPPRRVVPDARLVVVALADPALEKLPPPRVLARGEVGPEVQLYPQPPSPLWVGLWAVSARELGVPHGSFLARRDGAAIAPDWSWTSTPWGGELAVVFVPPVVMGGFRVVTPAGTQHFPEGEDAVLVADPHPFVPQSAIERLALAPPTADVGLCGQTGAPGTMRLARVRSPLVAWASDPQNGPARLDAGWVGSHLHRGSNDITRKVSAEISRIDDNVARIARAVTATVTGTVRAVASGDVSLDQLSAAVLATALSGPVGLALLSSKDPWRDAARVGAIYYALAYSPLMKATRDFADVNFGRGLAVQRAGGGTVAAAPGGQPLRLGLNDLAEPHFDVVGVGPTSASSIEAAEALGQQMMVLDREGAQALLVRVVEGFGQYGGGYIDLLFARLVVEAEADAEKRNQLLARFTAKQARWWDEYGQHIARAMSLVLDAFAPTVGTLLFQVAKALYQAAIVAQQMEVAARAQREAERRDREEIARLDAEIAALEASLGVPPSAGEPAPAPAGPAIAEQRPAPAAREPWYAPLVRWADREWRSPPPPARG